MTNRAADRWRNATCPRGVAACLVTVLWLGLSPARADDSALVPAERGYLNLTTHAYLPADFDQAVFDNLWKVWPAELREQARTASADERRRMAFSRYGLMERPGGNGSGPALGYVDDGKSGWVMNCLACHTGQVAGQVIPGLPNSHFALDTLTEEVRLTKLSMARALTHMDLGSLKMPLGTSRGTTNAVMFGVALGSLRDLNLDVRFDRPRPTMVHHDMDAPPFWNTRRKKFLYSDGFVAKSPRPLLQFVMLPENSGATIRGWEADYAEILAWIESLEAPRYPWAIDRGLARQGAAVFQRTCAQCHGTYGEHESFPDRIVPIDEVGTDPVRLNSLSVAYRAEMEQSWYGHYGERPYRTDPGGYVAPPLHGIWASAPYLHNGSVPTLWHLFHPDERPVVWRRTENGYDQSRIGLEIESFDDLPGSARTNADKREYFDTRRPGKSAAGHLFPAALTADEQQAVLEYLKTL